MQGNESDFESYLQDDLNLRSQPKDPFKDYSPHYNVNSFKNENQSYQSSQDEEVPGGKDPFKYSMRNSLSSECDKIKSQGQLEYNPPKAVNQEYEIQPAKVSEKFPKVILSTHTKKMPTKYPTESLRRPLPIIEESEKLNETDNDVKEPKKNEEKNVNQNKLRIRVSRNGDIYV